MLCRQENNINNYIAVIPPESCSYTSMIIGSKPNMTYPVVYLRIKNKLSRHEFGEGQKLVVGRDPSCDICINMQHISGFHIEFAKDITSNIICIDKSTNGTFIGHEKLQSGSPHTLGKNFTVLDLRLGVELAICHTSEQDDEFLNTTRSDIASEKKYNTNSTQSEKNNGKNDQVNQPASPAKPVRNTTSRKRKATMVIRVKRVSPITTYKKKQISSKTIMLLIVFFLGLAYLGLSSGREIGNYLSVTLGPLISQIKAHYGF